MEGISTNVFVINLDSRKDRWETIQSHLKTVGIHEYVRIPATCISFESIISPIKLSQISCFHSHLKTLRRAYDMNMEDVLILEDDCHFFTWAEHSLRASRDFIQNAKWEILYLGANRQIYRNNNTHIYKAKITPVTDHIVEISECGTTHAIMYRRPFMKKIVELFPTDEAFFQQTFGGEENQYVYDVFLSHFTFIRNIPKYCFRPILCGQTESYSDVQHSYSDYTKEMLDSWK